MSKIEIAFFSFVGLILVGVIGGLVAVAIDYSGTPDEGTVVSRHYSKESTTQVCTSGGGNVTICNPVTSPETWTIRIEQGDAEGPLDVSEEIHSRCVEGTHYPQCAQD